VPPRPRRAAVELAGNVPDRRKATAIPHRSG